MEIRRIGGRDVAFGLTWTESSDGPVAAAARVLGGTTPRFTYVTRTSAADGATIGVLGAEDRIGAKVVSAAQAMLSTGKDGLFVAPVTPNLLWYCGVQGGSVTVNTDVLGHPDAIAEQVSAVAGGLSLPVFLDSSLDGAAFAAARVEAMDVLGVLGRASAPPLRFPKRTGGLPVLPIVAVVAIAGLGWFGYRMFHHSGPDQSQVEQAQEQAKAQYLSKAKSALKDYPRNAAWSLGAVNMVYAMAPPFIAGWTLETIDCVPSACHLTYAHHGASSYAMTPLVDAFGKRQVRIAREGQTVDVTLPVRARTVDVSLAWLRSVKPSPVGFSDWLGSVPDAMDGAAVKGKALSEPVGKGIVAAGVALPNVVVEQAAVESGGFLSLPTLMHIVANGSRGGFKIVRVKWDVTMHPSWTAYWSRANG